MKIQALYDLHQEVNRLFIAGSKFAKGDPRISKHIAVLAKLGEKAPVFKKLSQDIEELVQTDTTASAEKLLNISVLLYSVLYTQGEATTGEALTGQQPTYALDEVRTTTSYLRLHPVITALTTSNVGRMGVVEDGFKQGVFNDFRTFDYVNQALGDKYSELADYIERTVVPSIGSKILPFIKAGFNTEGKAEDVRRFRLLYNLKDKDIQQLVDEVLAGSSVPLQAEAVLMLGDDLKNEQMVIALADDKNKAVRESAYMALAKFNTRQSLEKLTQAFLKNKNKGNIEGMVRAISSSGMPFCMQEVFEKIQADYRAFVELEATMDNQKEQSAAFEKLTEELPALYHKTDDYILQFLGDLVADQKFSKRVKSKDGTSLIKAIARNLLSLGEPGRKVLQHLSENRSAVKAWGSSIVEPYFMYCAKRMSAQQLFDTFHLYYTDKILRPQVFIFAYAKEDGHLHDSYFERAYLGYLISVPVDFGKIDPRWAGLFLNSPDKKEVELNNIAFYIGINCLDNKDEKLRNVLISKVNSIIAAKNIPDDFFFIAQRMVEAKVSGYQELLMRVFECIPNMSTSYSFITYRVASLLERFKTDGLIREFPKQYAERFRAIAAKNKLKNSRDPELLEELALLIEQQ